MSNKVIPVDFKARRRIPPKVEPLRVNLGEAASLKGWATWQCQPVAHPDTAWTKEEMKGDLSTARHVRSSCAYLLTHDFQNSFAAWQENRFEPADIVEHFHIITKDAPLLMSHLDVEWWLENGSHLHGDTNMPCGGHALFMFRRDRARGML